MENVKIEGRVVIITGPISSGKNWIAKTIKGGYPNDACHVIPFSKAKSQKKTTMKIETRRAQNEIERCVTSNIFAIVKTESITYEGLNNLIGAIRIMGYKDKITVIKIALSPDVHRNYWIKNHKKKKISWNKLVRERCIFEKILCNTSWNDSNVENVIITDPDDVRFELTLSV